MRLLLITSLAALALGFLALVAKAPRPEEPQTPMQSSLCAGCERAIVERERRPCPACGSINRIVFATARDRVGTADRVQ
jgi:hypothetical protein